MRQTEIHTMEIPKVSRDYAFSLQKRFPAKPISTDMTLAQIHDHAGEQRIISLILAEASGTSIIGNADNTKEATEDKLSNLPHINRMLLAKTNKKIPRDDRR